MENQFINLVLQKMLIFANNEQLKHMCWVLKEVLEDFTLSEKVSHESSCTDDCDLVAAFLAAKSIEGCSQKTLKYYQATLEAMVEAVGKSPQKMTTEDLRSYLANYQASRSTSKVTMDPNFPDYT